MGGEKNLPAISFRHKSVVLLYLHGLSQEKAMLEAGYSAHTARHNNPTMFRRPDVVAWIEHYQDEAVAGLKVSKEDVTRELVTIMHAGATLAKFKMVDPKTGQLSWDFRGASEGELALIDTLTTDTTYSLAGTKVRMKVGVPSRMSAIDTLCRIHGFNRDALELTGEMSLVERLQAGRARSTKREEGDAD